MTPMRTLSRHEDDTIKAAQDLASDLKPGDVLFLHGNLGAGKSVFARALIRALAGDKDLEVPSPTFTLVQTYDTPVGPVHHYDLYRLTQTDEIYELGWEDSLSQAITIVEWPERLGTLAPQRRLDIRITSIKNEPDSRDIEIIRSV
jgi:tRNA threonylcarbamoyl adenosine modification protein YjeE